MSSSKADARNLLRKIRQGNSAPYKTRNNVTNDNPSFYGQDQKNMNFELANKEHVEDCKQIKFSDDGEFMYRSIKDQVQVYDVRTRGVCFQTNDSNAEWMMDFILTGDRHEIVQSCNYMNGRSWRSQLNLWDTRYMAGPAGVIQAPKQTWTTTRYSQADNIFVTDGGGSQKSMMFYDKMSFSNNGTTGPVSELGSWTNIITDWSISADGKTMVMNTMYNFYIIIRNLCLTTFADDLKHFQPLHLVAEHSPLDGNMFEDYQEHLYIETLNSQSYGFVNNSTKNMPEVVLGEDWQCEEADCIPNIAISPTCDFFVGQGRTDQNQLFALYDLAQSNSSSRSQVRPSTATHVPPSQSSTSGSHPIIRISDDGSLLAVHSKQGKTNIMSAVKTWSPSDNNWNTSSNNWSSSLNSRSPSCPDYRQLELVQTVKTGKLRDIAFFPKSHIMVTVDVSGEVDWFVQKL